MSAVREMVLMFLLLVSLQGSSGGLLGAGEGEGSCAAPPFRAHYVHWPGGCPAFAPCCSEFGYCRPLAEWEYGEFRDCNGVSNGTPLHPEVLAAEEAVGPYHGKPAGNVGPPPESIKAQHVDHGEHHPQPSPHHHSADLVHSPPPPPTHHGAHSRQPPTPPNHHHAPAPQHVTHPAIHPHHVTHPVTNHQIIPVSHPLSHTVPHHVTLVKPATHHVTPVHSATHHVTPVHPVTHHVTPVHSATHHVKPVHPVTHHVTPVHSATHHVTPVHSATHHVTPVHPVTHHVTPVHSATHHVTTVHPATHHVTPVHPSTIPHHLPAPSPLVQHAVGRHVNLSALHSPHHTALASGPAHLLHPSHPPSHLPIQVSHAPSGPLHLAHTTHSPNPTPPTTVSVAVTPTASAPTSIPTSLPAVHRPSGTLRAVHSPPARPRPQNIHHSTHSSSPVSNLHGDINQPSLVSAFQQPTQKLAKLRTQPIVNIGQDSRSPSPLSVAPTVSTVQLRNSIQVTTPATTSPVRASTSPAPTPATVTTTRTASFHTSTPAGRALPRDFVREPKVLETESVGNLSPGTESQSVPTPGNTIQSERIKPQSRPRVVIPRIPVGQAQGDSQCQHPKGGGSYTCISFGAPHKPIFAFHTVQDQDGFFFGSGSGFDQENKNLLASPDNTIDSVRRARKVRVHKQFLDKLNRLKGKQNRTSRVTTYDFNSDKKKRMVTFPTLNGLPITAYQQRLLSQGDVEERPSVQRFEYPV